jgi:hypothetical protein
VAGLVIATSRPRASVRDLSRFVPYMGPRRRSRQGGRPSESREEEARQPPFEGRHRNAIDIRRPVEPWGVARLLQDFTPGVLQEFDRRPQQVAELDRRAQRRPQFQQGECSIVERYNT